MKKTKKIYLNLDYQVEKTELIYSLFGIILFIKTI